MTELPEIMKVSEVAKNLQVSKATVRRWIKDGTLKEAYQFGKNGDYRIKKNAVLNCLQEHGINNG